MNSERFLLAAYAVTWIIHIAYILYLGARARNLAEDMRELERTSQPPSDKTR